MPKLPPRYLDTVAMFERRNDGRGYAATGFFYRYFTGGAKGRTLLFLVTSARAVSGNLGDVRLVFRRSRGIRSLPYRASDADGMAVGNWLRDSERDVALLQLDPERLAAEAVRCQTFDVRGGDLGTREMKHRRVGEGDDVFVLGFTPENLQFHPMTMVRRGMIARIQDCYRGRSPTFLVDATTFAGNTGSPVVIRPNRGRGGQSLTHPRIHLIGLVSESLPNPEGPVRHLGKRRTLLVRAQTGLIRVVPVDAIHHLVRLAERDDSA